VGWDNHQLGKLIMVLLVWLQIKVITVILYTADKLLIIKLYPLLQRSL